MEHKLSLLGAAAERIAPLGEHFRGNSPGGDEISVNSYYLERNGRPFYGVGGELHFSRMDEGRWEDELIKMRMGGVSIVTTYVFWNHHEEVEGVFDFSGRRDLGRFIRLCHKHGLYVILRVGPFAHGEVRNGGLPDWLYGKPFEVRSLSEGFIDCTRRLYSEISARVQGMFFKDGGPIIGVQIDNEYMHSSAPWEMTTGISGEWAFGGDEGEEYLLRLRDLAHECGLDPVFYTCTGWGGAPVPDSMLPLWGGYSYRPWLFYSYSGEHPATQEYVYQDHHNNGARSTSHFFPPYEPESRPYALCEMGGGMMCSYYYRFQLPYKSVDAMANIRMASGCNMLGYYMYHGGSNPLGINGLSMNEGQVPKISYDYQAILGEFGQVRESYRRTKLLHLFARGFADLLCPMKTCLPEGASDIDPRDTDTLRYAVRTDGHGGFLFVNNFQDHAENHDLTGQSVTLETRKGDITFRFGIAAEENAILPFRMDMDGIELAWATAQPVTRLCRDGEPVYVFFVPRGMDGSFAFEGGASVNGGGNTYTCPGELDAAEFTVCKGEKRARVLALSRELAEEMYVISGQRLVFTPGALLEDDKGLRLETPRPENAVRCWPKDALAGRGEYLGGDILGGYRFVTEPSPVDGLELSPVQAGPSRYTLRFPKGLMEGVKDVLLKISYEGDIGHAFVKSRLVSDNFANGALWEIGLRELSGELEREEMVLYITPLRPGAKVNVDSPMAARREEAEGSLARLNGVRLCPVYELGL